MTLIIPSISVVPSLPFECEPDATQARDTYPCSRPKRRESCKYGRFWCRGRAAWTSLKCSRESPSRDGRSLWTSGLRWIREAHIKPLLYSERTQSSVLTIHQLGLASNTAAEVKNDSRATRETQGPWIVSLPMTCQIRGRLTLDQWRIYPLREACVSRAYVGRTRWAWVGG